MAKGKKIATKDGKTELDDLFTEDEDVIDAYELETLQANYRVYSFGSLDLDLATGAIDPLLGNGGCPQRTIGEIFGQNGSCKTTLALQLAKSVLQDPIEKDNYVLYLMAEESYVGKAMRSIGITEEQMKRVKFMSCYRGDNEDNLDAAEKSLDRIKVAVQNPRVKLAIIDSVKAMPLQNMLYDEDGNIKLLTDKEKLGMRATMMGAFLRDFKFCNRKCILLMLNQTADEIQLDMKSRYVNQHYTQKTPGGRAMEFECLLRIKTETRPHEHESINELTKKAPIIGLKVTCEIIKNKFCNATIGRIAESVFLFDPELNDMDFAGFDLERSLLRLGDFLTRKGHIPEEKGLVKAGGGNYNIQGTKVRGEPAAIEVLKANKSLAASLQSEITKQGRWIFDPEKIKKDIKEMMEADF